MADAEASRTADGRRSGRKVTAIAVAGITAVGMLAGGVAFAATGPGTGALSGSTWTQWMPGYDMAGMHQGPGSHRWHGGSSTMMGPGAPMGGIRGEFVARDATGAYRTYLTQSGTVTAVDSDSITVRSDDGYTHTYEIAPRTVVGAGRDGLSDVTSGDSVRLMARRGDEADTVLHLVDITGFKRGWRR